MVWKSLNFKSYLMVYVAWSSLESYIESTCISYFLFKEYIFIIIIASIYFIFLAIILYLAWLFQDCMGPVPSDTGPTCPVSRNGKL